MQPTQYTLEFRRAARYLRHPCVPWRAIRHRN
jgi:hypothetical protein